jgi:hypothetical protein
VTRKPLITKLSPNQTDIAENARRCIEAGSDAFAVINTLMGMAIDIETRDARHRQQPGRPVRARHQADRPAQGAPGLSGDTRARHPHHRPGRRDLATDAIEFLLAGAAAVGIGTALFYDPLILPKINQGILDYLDRHGLERVGELTGALRLNTPELKSAVRLLRPVPPLTENISVGLYSRHASPAGAENSQTDLERTMSDIEALKAEKATLIAEMLDMQKQFIDIEHQTASPAKTTTTRRTVC